MNSMKSVEMDILEKIMPYWKNREIADGDYIYFKYMNMDQYDGKTSSSRMTSDVAMGYLVYGLKTNKQSYVDKALRMMNYVIDNQDECGAFMLNFADPEVFDQVDLGTILDSYYYFIKSGVVGTDLRSRMLESTKKAVDYLSGAGVEGHPGVIKKRDFGPNVPVTMDILNGNALAATAFVRGSQLLNKPELLDKAAPYMNNLINRFSAHFNGWWPYCEMIDNRTVALTNAIGISVFYQAMTLLYMEPYYRERPDDRLRNVISEGLLAIDRMIDLNGRINYRYENRLDFVKTQNLMLPACFYALKDVADLKEKGRERLAFVRDSMISSDGTLLNEDGKESDDYRRIWLVSDVALCILRGGMNHVLKF